MLEESYDELTGMITLSRVIVTADLSEAKVYISVMEQDPVEALRVLKKNIYEIQGKLNKRLMLRKIPRISFLIDERSEVADRINRLIDESRA